MNKLDKISLLRKRIEEYSLGLLETKEILKNIESQKEITINELIFEYEKENSNIINKEIITGEYTVQALQYNYESHLSIGIILKIDISEEVYVSTEVSNKLYKYAYATKGEHIKDVNINLNVVF